MTMQHWLSFKQQVDTYQKTNAPPAYRPKGAPPSNLSKQTELAGCDVRYAIFFCFLFPIVGYIYTGRFKAFGIFLAGTVAAILGLSYALSEQITQSEKMQFPLSLGISTIAAADNSRAILSARRAIQRD